MIKLTVRLKDWSERKITVHLQKGYWKLLLIGKMCLRGIKKKSLCFQQKRWQILLLRTTKIMTLLWLQSRIWGAICQIKILVLFIVTTINHLYIQPNLQGYFIKLTYSIWGMTLIVTLTKFILMKTLHLVSIPLELWKVH